MSTKLNQIPAYQGDFSLREILLGDGTYPARHEATAICLYTIRDIIRECTNITV